MTLSRRGVICMQNKIVIITGAGFSAPAKLPLQSDVLKEMSQQPTPSSILEFDVVSDESIKFLHSFITVAIYLLEKYVDSKYAYLYDEYRNLIQAYSSKTEAIIKTVAYKSSELFSSEYYSKLVIMKETIRGLLEHSKLDISLEDVFTSFDKTIIAGEYLEGYSHHRLDAIRQSITRMFTYYFTRRLSQHDYSTQSYTSFLRYVNAQKSQVGIITTNWDSLLETYFEKHKLDYNLCLNEPYYRFDDKRKNNQSNKGIKYIKIHGSINWFYCLNCGTLSIIEKNAHPNFLFDDNSEEECTVCHLKPNRDEILLQPAIITPTMLKSIGNQLYRNLWTAAQRELMTATKVIFLGYSFPMADFEFRYLLQRNINHNAQIDVVLYKNDNPNKITRSNEHLKDLLPEKRYRDAFRQNSINYFYKGFDDYFKSEVNQ